MDFLSSQLRQIGEQLRGTSVSQRAAIGLLVVVLIGGMYGLVRWSGQPEWVPLLPQSFTPEQIQSIQASLAVAGERSKVDGDRILIQGDEGRREQLTAMLAQSGSLPKDTSLGYAALVKASSVFMGDRSRVWMENRGLEAELSGVIGRFRGVKDAHVFIEVPQTRGFSGKSTQSRASVHLTLAEGESLDKQRVAAIANFVAGAVSGLDPRNVKITDGVRFYRPPESTGEVPSELLDIQRHAEDYHSQKVYDQLRYIPGVLVNVHAQLRTSEEQIQEKTLGPPAVDNETSRTEETRSASTATGPGVRPNQGRSISDGGTGTSNTKEETETSLKGERDTKVRSTNHAVGVVEKLTAAINVPRSYLERIASAVGAAGGGGGQPDDAVIGKIAEAELPKIRALVKPLINATSDEQVVVNWYYDMAAPESSAPATQSTGMVALARDYGAQIGVGLLVLFSLFMLMRLARQGAGAIGRAGRNRPVPAGASIGGGFGGFGDPDGPLQKLGGGTMLVGEAEETDAVMEGHEVDEKTVRTHQIVQQISQMVREDPASAANIVHHWLQEEK
ncbi:MAG: hypothetical protein HBSAPP02_06740 [Phycisphaerae bacterium]|nr:MAG: hypothetical protein HRU71_10125 [Planctomycetia bacterium]GJQ25642.1 MAG: hypothetical protein HBSAPP02_06740 [Phycisphaerae bacterium]